VITQAPVPLGEEEETVPCVPRNLSGTAAVVALFNPVVEPAVSLFLGNYTNTVAVGNVDLKSFVIQDLPL
jgi:hypothetical protein